MGGLATPYPTDGAVVKPGSTLRNVLAGDFADLLRRFDGWMAAQAMSERTRHTYRYQLTLFYCDYLVLHDLDLLTATEDDVHAYVRTIEAQGKGRGDAMRAVKAFYKWASGRVRDDNPATALKIPRPKVAPAPSLDLPEQRALISAAFRREPRRGWAIVLVLETGMRVSSLVAVRSEDVHLSDADGAWVWIREAKGDRPYRHPLERAGHRAAAALILAGHDPLLGVGAARFRQWIHEAEEDAGLGRVWPHLLRHTYSKRLAAAGDVESWRRGMNHADLSQFSRYNVEEDDRRLRAALQRGRGRR